MSIIIKRWADLAIPFYYMRYYWNLHFETSHKHDAQHPNWCWSNENARAVDFFAPPLLKEQNYGQLFFFDQQLRQLLAISEISFKLFAQHWMKSGSCIFFSKSGCKVAHFQYLLLYNLWFTVIFRKEIWERNGNYSTFGGQFFFPNKRGKFKAQSIKQKLIFSAFNTANWGQFPIYGGKFQ